MYPYSAAILGGKLLQAGIYAQRVLAPWVVKTKAVYARELSAETDERYEKKITATAAGLQIDPYSIENDYWTREPEMIPQLMWTDGDLVFYVISTPSEYSATHQKRWYVVWTVLVVQ